MGIHHFVFAVNKMDLVGYSEERFNEIVKDINELSENLGLQDVVIIPVSATEGDNVTVNLRTCLVYRQNTFGSSGNSRCDRDRERSRILHAGSESLPS